MIFTPFMGREYEEQRNLFRGYEPGFEERDLLTSVFPEDGEASEARATYGVKTGQFVVVLVGRDGGEKFRSGEPVLAEELFEKIDAMPMRRREMREN